MSERGEVPAIAPESQVRTHVDLLAAKIPVLYCQAVIEAGHEVDIGLVKESTGQTRASGAASGEAPTNRCVTSHPFRTLFPLLS